MKKLLALFLFIAIYQVAFTQIQPIEKPEKGYRFQHRIKGPDHKKSEVLELMVDEHGNYLVATFRGEKSKYIYLYVYNLYTWDEEYKIKLDDNRCELYNSMFDESGDYFYVNYDIYRNLYKKIDLKTGVIEKVDCSLTPKGCHKIEPQFYRVDVYTIGENYYIYRDDKLLNYIRILVKKEMYIPKEGEEGGMSSESAKYAQLDPAKGGIMQITPAEVRDLKAGNEIEKNGLPVFYDPNSIDANGDEIPYEITEGQPYKIRLTPVQISKLEKKISFVYQKLVIKLDLDAFEEEQKNKNQQ